MWGCWPHAPRTAASRRGADRTSWVRRERAFAGCARALRSKRRWLHLAGSGGGKGLMWDDVPRPLGLAASRRRARPWALPASARCGLVGLRPTPPLAAASRRVLSHCPRTGSGSLPGGHQGVACSTAREGVCRVVPAGDRRQDPGTRCIAAVRRRPRGVEPGGPPDPSPDMHPRPKHPNGLGFAYRRTPTGHVVDPRQGACRVVPAGDRRQHPGTRCIAAVRRRPRGVEPGGPPDPPPDKGPRLKHPGPCPKHPTPHKGPNPKHPRPKHPGPCPKHPTPDKHPRLKHPAPHKGRHPAPPQQPSPRRPHQPPPQIRHVLHQHPRPMHPELAVHQRQSQRQPLHRVHRSRPQPAPAPRRRYRRAQ